jgi:SAM-dependent methyltransferase
LAGYIDRREGRALFGPDVGNYDDVRPAYPEQVYRFLVETGALRANVATLEIGAGNGLATRRLLEYGVNPLTLIEPDKRFASMLRSMADTYQSDTRIIEDSFEDAELPGGQFDLVAFATAFHWIDPVTGMARVAELLKPGGHAALWWNVFGDPDRHDAFHEATHPVLRHLSTSPSDPPGKLPFGLDVDERIGDFSRTGMFDQPTFEAYKWTLVLNAEQVGGLYATFSGISRLPDDQRRAVLNQLMEIAERQFGGRVERNMVSPVYVARRHLTL